MGLYSAGGTSSGAGTAARPIGSLMGVASIRGVIREIGIFQTVAVAQIVRLVRVTAAGTPGSTFTAGKLSDSDQPAANLTAKDTHSADATIGDDLGFSVQLPATIGAGVIWNESDFGPMGIRVPPGTANGVGILPVGTGQIVRWHVLWEE